jgi:hypothetical protein
MNPSQLLALWAATIATAHLPGEVHRRPGAGADLLCPHQVSRQAVPRPVRCRNFLPDLSSRTLTPSAPSSDFAPGSINTTPAASSALRHLCSVERRGSACLGWLALARDLAHCTTPITSYQRICR